MTPRLISAAVAAASLIHTPDTMMPDLLSRRDPNVVGPPQPIRWKRRGKPRFPRMRIADTPTVDKAELKKSVAQAKLANAPLIDGGYLLASKKPFVDHVDVFDPRTHEQHKAARVVASKGRYVGFVYP
jgi:hypothetical protein